MARTFSDGVEGQPGAPPVSTLASGIAAAAVSLTVAAGHGARFPATGPFTIRIESATDPNSFEHVDCSARATDVLTIGATTFAWSAGANVMHALAKADFDAIWTDLAAKQALSGVAGFRVPGAQATRITSNQTLPITTVTPLEWNSETYDTDGFHDNTTTPNRFTIPSGLDGLYLVSVSCSFSAATTYEINVRKNGSNTGWVNRTGFTYIGTPPVVVDCAAGDYIDVTVYPYAASNLMAQVYSRIAITRLGPRP